MIQKMGIMGNIFRYLPNSIYGYDIAVKDALSAILRYGTFQSLVVFYDPRQYQERKLPVRVPVALAFCFTEKIILRA